MPRILASHTHVPAIRASDTGSRTDHKNATGRSI